MGEDVLQRIGQLKGVHVAETKLDVCIDDEFGEAKDLATKMESISKARFFPFFGRKRPEENGECPAA